MKSKTASNDFLRKSGRFRSNGLQVTNGVSYGVTITAGFADPLRKFSTHGNSYPIRRMVDRSIRLDRRDLCRADNTPAGFSVLGKSQRSGALFNRTGTSVLPSFLSAQIFDAAMKGRVPEDRWGTAHPEIGGDMPTGVDACRSGATSGRHEQSCCVPV
jgi:hypothetical protein